MKNEKKFNEFLQAVAAYYNADFNRVALGESFALEIPKAALLGQNIQQSSEFLQKINWIQVRDIVGNKLFGATEKGVTGRKKEGRHLATLSHTQGKYELVETDSGIIVPWQMFDQFAAFGDRLPALYAEYFNTQVALDQLQVGWHGKSVAENTSKSDLSDVNKGWLQLLKEQKSENIYQGNANKITLYGTNAEFSNLDELALDLKQGLDTRHQNRTDLVFLVGADLVNAEARYLSKTSGLTATERAALGATKLMSRFGGMDSMTPPNFPAKGAVVTTLKNLSIYTQDASVRRRFKNDDDRKGIISGYYRNEGYVVEDVGLMTAVNADNVVIGTPGQAISG